MPRSEETGQRSTGGRREGPAGSLYSATLFFSSRIYIMDLPRTTSEIESLHRYAPIVGNPCLNSYYPFALCDARIFHVVNCAPLVAGSRCSWERLEKISGCIISDTPFRTRRRLSPPAVPFRANVCVTDDISRNSLENRRISYIYQIISSSLYFFKSSSLLYVIFSLKMHQLFILSLNCSSERLLLI